MFFLLFLSSLFLHIFYHFKAHVSVLKFLARKCFYCSFKKIMFYVRVGTSYRRKEFQATYTQNRILVPLSGVFQISEAHCWPFFVGFTTGIMLMLNEYFEFSCTCTWTGKRCRNERARLTCIFLLSTVAWKFQNLNMFYKIYTVKTMYKVLLTPKPNETNSRTCGIRNE